MVVAAAVTVVAPLVVEAVVGVAVDAMACARAFVDALVGVVVVNVRADKLICAVIEGGIASDFAVTVPRTIDNVLSDVSAVIIVGVLSGIGNGVLVDANANAFTAVIAVGFAMPSPLESR